MQFEFSGAVLAEQPPESDRTWQSRTYMLTGIAVTWDTAPTTSEEVTLKIVGPPPVSAEPLVVAYDPTDDSAVSWVHKIAEGPIPIIGDMVARVEYPNSDSRNVKVMFLSYWR